MANTEEHNELKSNNRIENGTLKNNGHTAVRKSSNIYINEKYLLLEFICAAIGCCEAVWWGWHSQWRKFEW